MSWVALIGEAVSRHADWAEALDHVALAHGINAAVCWFQDWPDGACIFRGPPGTRLNPIARVFDPVQYQRARSRGDLEDPTQISGRAGAFTLRPGPTQTIHMSTLLETTKNAAQKTTTFYVTRKLQWRGERYADGDTIEATPAEQQGEKVTAWLAHGWIEPMRDGKRVPFLTYAPASAPQGEKKPQTLSAELPLGQNPDAAKASKAGRFLPDVLLASICRSPWNPRKDFTSPAALEYLKGLAQSIREQGIIEPLIIRPSDQSGYEYELVAGECRWRAAAEAGLAGVPCILRHLDKVAAIRQQAVENLQRRDINAMEECEGYELLMREGGYTVKDICRETGKSEPTVYARLKLKDCPPGIRKAVEEDRLPASTAELVARVDDVTLRCAFMDAILFPPKDAPGEERGGVLSFRQAKQWLEVAKQRVATEAQWQAKVKACALAKGAAKVLSAEESSKVVGCGYVKDPNKYVRPVDICHGDPERRTYAELAKANHRELPAPIVVCDGASGKPMAILPRAETEKALEGLMRTDDELERARKEEKTRREQQWEQERTQREEEARQVQARAKNVVDACKRGTWNAVDAERVLRFAVGNLLAPLADDEDDFAAALIDLGVQVQASEKATVATLEWRREYLDGCDARMLRAWLMWFAVRDGEYYTPMIDEDRLWDAEILLGLRPDEPRPPAVEEDEAEDEDEAEVAVV